MIYGTYREEEEEEGPLYSIYCKDGLYCKEINHAVVQDPDRFCMLAAGAAMLCESSFPFFFFPLCSINLFCRQLHSYLQHLLLNIACCSFLLTCLIYRVSCPL